MDQKQLTRLVERSRVGDRAAQEELIAAVQNLVYFHCCKLVGDRETALDLTQEILITMVTGLPKLQEPAAFRSWLLKIVYTRCKNHWRRSPKECQIPETEDGDSLLDTWADDDIQTIPDQALDRSETVRILRELVDGLTPEQRTCVLLYYYDELKVSEIATVLSVPETTVKSRLFHARKALRDGILRQERRSGGLYSLALAPLMGWLLRSEADAGALPAAESASLTASTLSSAASATGTAAAATSVVGTIAKIAVCVAVIGATVGGVWTLRDLRKTKPPEVGEMETAETGTLAWDPADAAAWETRLAQDETFLKNFDSLTDDPMIDIGRGWRDDQGRLHLEYRNYSSYFWSLREVVLEGDEDDWTIYSDGPAEGLYVTEDPQGRLLTDQEYYDIVNGWLRTTSAPIRAQFLTADFRTPEEISFYDVFYHGAHPMEPENLSDAEQMAALGYVSHLDVSKAETGEMDQILRELTGISMADCYGYGLGKFQYVEQYDAYYFEHGDTNSTANAPWKGWMLGDGSVCLRYTVRNEPYEVKLAPHGEGWQFVYNRPLQQQMAVNEEAMQDLSRLAESFVVNTVLMPPEIAMPTTPFAFDTPSDLTDDQMVTLFLLWTDYFELEKCLDTDGMFYFQESMIRSTLDRYFKEYDFDITQCDTYDADRQAVVLRNASGFGGDRDMRIVDIQVEGNTVTYTVDFHADLYYDGTPGTYVYMRKIYEIEYYLGGWYYLSARVVPVE